MGCVEARTFGIGYTPNHVLEPADIQVFLGLWKVRINILA